MNRTAGIRIAREFKALLFLRGYPVRRVVLFGSVAKNEARAQSDIDIAVITDPFKRSRIEEGGAILLESKDIDVRIETVTIHTDDFDRPTPRSRAKLSGPGWTCDSPRRRTTEKGPKQSLGPVRG